MFFISEIKTQLLWNSGVLFSHLNKQTGQSGVFESQSDCLSDSKSPVTLTRGLYACLCVFMCVCAFVRGWACHTVSLLFRFLPVLSLCLSGFFFYLLLLALVCMWRWCSLPAWVIFRALLTRLSYSAYNEEREDECKKPPLHHFYPLVH